MESGLTELGEAGLGVVPGFWPLVVEMLAAFMNSGDVWPGDGNLGSDDLWMVFKATRLGDVSKEVCMDRVQPSSHTLTHTQHGRRGETSQGDLGGTREGGDPGKRFLKAMGRFGQQWELGTASPWSIGGLRAGNSCLFSQHQWVILFLLIFFVCVWFWGLNSGPTP
jgi:hypothetical protein